MRKHIQDYIDCIIVATAAVLKEDLVTQDTLILSNKGLINEKYVRVLSYKNIVNDTNFAN